LKIYSTTEAAAELEIEPKALRRFLRSDPARRNAGQGGRYVFTDPDLASLRHSLKRAGYEVRVPSTEIDRPFLDDDPGCSLDKLLWAQGDRAALGRLRDERREARADRQQRLRVRIDEVLPDRYDDEDFMTYSERVGW
jgi:hypothetical protein